MTNFRIFLLFALSMLTGTAMAEAQWVYLMGDKPTSGYTFTQVDGNKYVNTWTDGTYSITPDATNPGNFRRGWWTNASGTRIYNFYVKNTTFDLSVPANISVKQVRVRDLEASASGQSITVTSEGATFSPASVSLTAGTSWVEKDYDMEVTNHTAGAPLHFVTTGGTFGFALALLVEKDENVAPTPNWTSITDGQTVDRNRGYIILRYPERVTLTEDVEATLDGVAVKLTHFTDTILCNFSGDWNSSHTFCLKAGSVISYKGKVSDKDVNINFNIGAEPQLAFPGAEGGGMYTSGGRGGKVYHVTTLEDSTSPTEGMLRYAINQSGKRTVVFDVAGTIYLEDRLSVTNGDLTIAGQTAPGQGITLADHELSVTADNVIVRYIRVRMGSSMLSDGEGEGADAMGGRGHKNIIIDHCSCCWSTDECVSFYGNQNFTLQWSIISESLSNSAHPKGAHGYGGIWGGSYATFHHNYMAHHQSRTPRWGFYYGQLAPDMVDMRCNFIYNWSGEGCYGAEGMNGNIVNNFYKPGLASPTSAKRGRIMAAGVNGTTYQASNYDGRRPRIGCLYVDGNLVSSNQNDPAHPTNTYEKNATNNNWTYGIYNQISNYSNADKDTMKAGVEYAHDYVTMHKPVVVMDKVLSYAGCSLNRDAIDERLATEGRDGTCTFKGSTGGVWGLIDTEWDTEPEGASSSWTPWPELTGGSRSSSFDTDGDGMADYWEDTYNLDPADPLDGNAICSHAGYQGYTELEHYMASLVATITKNQNADAIKKGDVNQDGAVDISDVNAIIAVICGTTSNSQADVNGDGTVDISDVNAVISIICGE